MTEEFRELTHEDGTSKYSWFNVEDALAAGVVLDRDEILGIIAEGEEQIRQYDERLNGFIRRLHELEQKGTNKEDGGLGTTQEDLSDNITRLTDELEAVRVKLEKVRALSK